MKKDFILLFFLLSISYQLNAQNERDSLILVLKEEINLNTKFLESIGSNDSSYYKSRDKVEKFNDYFDSILPRCKELICKTKDSELLKEFLNVLVSTTNSADEVPIWEYAEIYICQPDFTLKTINNFKYRQSALKILDGALDYYPTDLQNKIKNYKQLVQRVQFEIQNKR
jgi:hypothetical protein